MSKEWINDVATINESKKGKLYIKFNKGVDFKEGDTLVLKSKRQEIDESVNAGKITEEKGNELKEKLSFIKYICHKPPRD